MWLPCTRPEPYCRYFRPSTAGAPEELNEIQRTSCFADRGCFAPFRSVGAGRVRADRQQAGRGRQRRTREPSIAAPEQKAKPRVKPQAAPAPRRNARRAASRISSATSRQRAGAPAAGRARRRPHRERQRANGQGASQFMLQRAASSYSTSSNALGFGLYRVTPRETVQFKRAARARHHPRAPAREAALLRERRRHRDPLCHRGRPRGRGLVRHLERLRQARMAGLDADARTSSPSSPICRAMSMAARPIRWAHARSISARPCTASTAPTSRGGSARKPPRAASA